MDALELRDVDQATRVAGDDHARGVQRGHRPPAALGDRLRAPADALAALEDLPDEGVPLELLEHVVAARAVASR